MKSWDLQSGNFIRTFGVRTRGPTDSQKISLKIHKGPVKVVYVHDAFQSLAFSGSACEVLVWTLEEGVLLETLTDHTRPVSAICCYQVSDKHPACLVSGGQDSVIMVYSLRDHYAVQHKLQNDAGPINDLQIPLLALNGSKEQVPVIVAACFDGSVQIWNLGSGEWLSSVHLPHGPVNALCVLPTPVPCLVTGHGDGMVLLISLKTQELLCSLNKKNCVTPATTAETRPPHQHQPHPPRSRAGDALDMSTPVMSLSYTMFPRPMVLAGYQDPEVYVWDLNEGTSEDAVMLQEVLVLDLLWKDPLIAHDSDDDSDEDGER
jgi:WD40 repeat protein